MRIGVDRIIDSAMDKYSIPGWVRPYVYDYVRSNPLSSVKYAVSLLDVKRRKGEVTKRYVKLPNGTTFQIGSILKLLNLFYYGEDNIARMEMQWATKSADHNAEYEKNYMEMSDMDSKYTRAIKNLTEGLGHTVGEEQKSITDAFEYISGIEPWHDRVITTGLILRCAYAKTFGVLFYKAFYPVSPEFMRSFGKTFKSKPDIERWDMVESERLVANGSVNREHVLELTREVLSRILLPIRHNESLSKELRLEKEVRLITDISIAYPFQRLYELGLELDVEEEVKKVKSMLSESEK